MVTLVPYILDFPKPANHQTLADNVSHDDTNENMGNSMTVAC